MEIVTSWMRKGIEQGRVEGRVEGQIEGALQVVLRQLGRRLGSVPPSVEARLHALSSSELQELAEALLDFAQPADLERWLTRLPER